MGLPFWSLNRGNRGLLKILILSFTVYRADDKKNDTSSCRICVIYNYIIYKIILHAIQCLSDRRIHSTLSCSTVRRLSPEQPG